MKIAKVLFISTLLIAMVGCGSSSDGDSGNNGNSGGTAETTHELGNTSYHVPDGVKLINAEIKNTDAKMMASGAKEELAGFIQDTGIPGQSTKGLNTLQKSQTIQKGVSTVFSQLAADKTLVQNISLLSSQSFQTPYVYTVAHYQLVTNDSMQPLTLAGKIVNIIAGGKATGLPVADANAPSDTNFRFVLLYGDYQGSTFYIAVVIPENQYAQYATTISQITTAARVTPKGKKLQSSTEKFTTNTGNQKADILFVVDDSGSMGNDQDALAQAAVDFTTEMSNSGLHYRSAIITTGYGATDHVNGKAYKILRDVGIIENNATLLKEKLVAGTGGSGTETGIWNAEQSLQSTAHGDAVNGAVTTLGMPQTDATLSVVIISDEPSQYSRRSTGYADFNVSDNLFLDRNITVYSLIKPYYSYATTGIFDEHNKSQYDDLANVTHGMYSDIRNADANGTLTYRTFMAQIAQDAGGAASSIILSHSAAVITEVKVNGTVVSEDTANGFTYVQASNSIVFHGTALPAAGSTIEVSYKYYQ